MGFLDESLIASQLVGAGFPESGLFRRTKKGEDFRERLLQGDDGGVRFSNEDVDAQCRDVLGDRASRVVGGRADGKRGLPNVRAGGAVFPLVDVAGGVEEGARAVAGDGSNATLKDDSVTVLT